MTCGIYILYWDVSIPYIGQSINFSIRKTKHLSELRNSTHCNYKITNAYDKYKIMPNIELLEECASDSLNDLECYYIKEFDSIAHGLNIISGGYSVGLGTSNSNSKYTRDQLIDVFRLLTDVNKDYTSISNLTKVHRSTVNQIARGVQHVWLKEEFPEIFLLIEQNYFIRASVVQRVQNKKTVYPNVLDPNGVIHSITTNLTDFCTLHNLQDTNMYKVFKGTRMQHKGWTLA